ncbi:MAG: AAA family ATPase [Gammaproteobacteria bacterium]|nr:AAA family ATPase [Gammaproteobacteria bacterium]
MIKEVASRLRENIQKVIIGKDEMIELTLVAVLCEGHLLLEDVPGIGKTTLARALAASLGCTFRRIQFTPDLLPSDVTGLNWFNQKEQAFKFRPGPIISHVVLADEINRATPRTQSALLEAMQERQITVDGVTRMLPRPFLVMATQNPVELEGTFPLPDLEAVTNPDEILQLQAERREIRVEESVRDYIVRVSRATRAHPEIELGASPRASLALYWASQAWAGIKGRDFVLPDDVKFMAPNVLTHRLIISPQAQLRGRLPQELVADIVDAVPVPVED